MNRKIPFFAGFMSAALIFGAGAALAAADMIEFNTAGLRIGGSQVSEPDSFLTTEEGAEIPAVILYTDEMGGQTHYIPVRQLADHLDVPLALAEDGYIELGIASAAPYSVQKGMTAVYNNEFKEYEDMLTPAGGEKVLLSLDYTGSEPYAAALDIKPEDGRYVNVTVENNSDHDIWFSIGSAENSELDGLSLTGLVLPSGLSQTRSMEIITEDGTLRWPMCLGVEFDEETDAPYDVTITAVQFDAAE